MMGVREDVVSSAVTFLQDPSVGNAPLDKRIAFLQSKNLTQEEIDVALARAGDGSASANPGYSQQVMRQPPPQYGYGPQYNGAYWPQQAPPEPPRRDWRDYFIMATVMGGVGYGMYFVAKRYIVPLIAPPTPPQLEQDKAAIDEAFQRAFELIDQVKTDTEEIKRSEQKRTDRLDAALTEVESVISELKQSSRRRDDDTRRINDEVRSLQSMIPRAMEAQAKDQDSRLKELNTELKSLKTLISNRMGATAAAPAAPRPATPVTANSSYPQYGSTNVNGTPSSATIQPTATETAPNGTTEPAKPSTNPYSARFGSGKAGIPAWQMAAKNQSESSDKKDTSESGTVSESSAT